MYTTAHKEGRYVPRPVSHFTSEAAEGLLGLTKDQQQAHMRLNTAKTVKLVLCLPNSTFKIPYK